MLAVVTPFQKASASGPESQFAISISGTDDNAYFVPDGHAQVNVTQTWNVSSPGNYEGIQVFVSSGSKLYYFNFATRYGSGKRFAVGYYPWAQNYPGILRQGRPGISVLGGPDPTCGTQHGSFEVRDIGRSGLEITRMSIVFTRWCEDGQVDTGHVQFGYPATTYNVSPRVVTWPWSTVYPGNRAPEDHAVNVRLTSSKTVTVSQPKVTGADAADFPIDQQNCGGKKLTTAGCVIWVGFTPKKPGPRHATLVVPTSAGSTSISLNGLGGIGTSTWTVSTDWSGTPPNFSMPSISAGDPYSVISQGDGTNLWTADFATHNGKPLQPGTTYNYSSAISPPFSMSIAQGDAGCELSSGSVKVNDLATVGPDHQLARMNAVLTASCKSSVPFSVTATMRFHETTDLTAPGPVKGLKAVRKGSQIILTWTKPAAPDLAGIIICWYAGASAPSIWSSGNTAYVGTGTSASFTTTSKSVSITAWAYDKTGNISTGSLIHVS